MRSVTFFGHIISSEGTEIDLNKMAETLESKSFLGLARYYRRFVDGFSSIGSPLTTLTQKNAKFEWSEACERGFHELKDKLTSIVVLTLSECNQGFVVYCDAFSSRFGFCPLEKW